MESKDPPDDHRGLIVVLHMSRTRSSPPLNQIQSISLSYLIRSRVLFSLLCSSLLCISYHSGESEEDGRSVSVLLSSTLFNSQSHDQNALYEMYLFVFLLLLQSSSSSCLSIRSDQTRCSGAQIVALMSFFLMERIIRLSFFAILFFSWCRRRL